MSKTLRLNAKAGVALALGSVIVLFLGPAAGFAQEAPKQGLFGPWQATA